jgi:lipid-A-disaccharide synthase-like uncharacterized protein
MDLSFFKVDGNQFLGVEWHVWKVIGWVGNLVFFSRFFVQWVATEKKKRVVVPASFWWLSLTGSILLLIYGLWVRDSVFIFSYAFTWIPYVRNLVIDHRNKARQKFCQACGVPAYRDAAFCHKCGSEVGTAAVEKKPVPYTVPVPSGGYELSPRARPAPIL